MAVIDDDLQALNQAVAQNTSVEQSVLAALNGVPAQIQAAVNQALAAGATPEQLKAITDATAAITANNTALAAAVVASTPAAPPATT